MKGYAENRGRRELDGGAGAEEAMDAQGIGDCDTVAAQLTNPSASIC